MIAIKDGLIVGTFSLHGDRYKIYFTIQYVTTPGCLVKETL